MSAFLVRLTARFLSRLTATFRRAPKSRLLDKFRSRYVRVRASRLTTACERVRGVMCARCRYCAVEKFRCVLIVALRCAGVVARTFAVRCAFALSGLLSLVCAPHAVSASARLPIHTEYMILLIVFPFSVETLDKIQDPIIQHR